MHDDAILVLQAWAKGSSHEACVEATCGPDDGTVLRAPTEKQGLIPLCKDTFLGKVSSHTATAIHLAFVQPELRPDCYSKQLHLAYRLLLSVAHASAS